MQTQLNKDQTHDPYAALRYPDFRRFWGGGVVSSVGANMQNVAVGWEIYQRTGSELALGLVGLAEIIPVFVLTIPAGHMADRFDRRRIILFAQLIIAASALGLAARVHLKGPLWLMYALLALTGAGTAIKGPSRSSIVPQLVPREVFPNAATYNGMGFQTSAVVGPALGGAVIAITKTTAWVFLADAVCALIFFLLVLRLRFSNPPRNDEPVSVQSLLAGYRYVLSKKTILSAITLDMVAILLGGAAALFPVYATDILKVGPEGYGWLRAAPSVGAVIMSVTLTRLPPFKRAGRALLWSIAGFGLCTVVFGVSQSFILSVAVMAIAGGLDMINVVIRHSLIQLGTPDHLRGRVSAVNGVFISVSNELGTLESGVVAFYMGPVFSVVSGGIGTVVVVILVATAWPEIRRLGKLTDAHVD